MCLSGFINTKDSQYQFSVPRILNASIVGSELETMTKPKQKYSLNEINQKIQSSLTLYCQKWPLQVSLTTRQMMINNLIV